MTKLDKLSQAEHMYVCEHQSLDVIGAELDLSRRTLFYWKKEYDWNKKKFEKGREQELFNRELLNFAQKIMDKISNDIDNNQQTPQAEMYSLMNILKNLPQVKSNIEISQTKHKSKKEEYLPEDRIAELLKDSSVFNDFLLYPSQKDTADSIIKNNNEFIGQNFYGEDTELNKFGSVILKYKESGEKAYSDLLDKLNNHNIRNVAEQYGNLYDSTIKSMEDVASGKTQYSVFWIKEKKLGKRNLADLLIESLHYDKAEILKMNASQKARIINTALQRQGKFESFYDVILKNWLNDIFNQEKKNAPDNIKTQSKENYEELKNLMHNLKRNDENAFIEFLKADNTDNIILGDKKVIDIMLEAIQDNDENYLDKDFAFKKKVLIAYAEFPGLREKAINAVLKKIVKAELQSEAENSNASACLSANLKTIKLNSALVKKLYTIMPYHKADEVISSLKDDANDYKQSLRNLIPLNPLANNFGINDAKYALVFALLKDAVHTAPDGTSKNILELLNKFSKAYTQIENGVKPDINTEKLWHKLTTIAVAHWNNKHLPQILNNRLQAIIDLSQLKKGASQIEDETISSIREVLKSSEYTPEQRAFVLKRSIQDGYDFRRFITQDKPNAYLRKEFISSLMQKENDLENDFKLFQEDFIHSVRIKDIDPYVNLQTPYGNFIALLRKHLNLKFMSLTELTQKLNNLSDDELNLLTDKIKTSYFEMKRKSDFIAETN